MITLIIGFIVLVGTIVLLALSLVLGFLVAPFRTLALILEKLAGIASIICIVMIGTILYFSHQNHIAILKDQTFLLFIATLVMCILFGGFCRWFQDRPTRAERHTLEQSIQECRHQTRQHTCKRLAYEHRMHTKQQHRQDNSLK